jgi:hypothetical protein
MNNKQIVMTQEEAVFQAISNVFGAIEDGTKVELSKEERAQVTEILVEGFKSGKIALKDTPSNNEKLSDDAKLRSYCSGLQSNWLRKDPRLNGNTKYVAKNPGSRAGSADATVKSMRTLLATREDLTAQDRAEIQAAISKRVAELKPAKTAELTPEQIEVLKAAGFSKFFSN